MHAHHALAYAVSLPYTDTTLVVCCKCGTDTILTWVREVIKGWDHDKAVSKKIHDRMRPATHAGTIYGKTLFIVRNPLHRFVSCYYDRINNPRYSQYYRPDCSIEQWSHDLKSEKYRHSNEHWRPQAAALNMIHDTTRMTVVDLYNVKPHLDHLLAQVGCPSPPLVNDKSTQKRYAGRPEDLVTEIILQNLRESYADDIRLYDRAIRTPTP